MTSPYLIELAKLGVNVAFWPAFLFTPLISFVWPWWKSFWGINIVTLEIAIMLALINAVLSTDFGLHVTNSVALAWVEIAALYLVGAIVTWRGFLVIIEQVRGVRRERIRENAREQKNGNEPAAPR